LGLLLIFGLYRGLKNGLLIELASIVALIAGIYGAIHFSYLTADYLAERINWELRTIKIAAFIITFLLIVFGVHLLGKVLTRIADIALLGLVNRIAGALFGALKVAVILGALLIFIERANTRLSMIESDMVQNSVLYQPIRELGALVFGAILEADIHIELKKNQD
jgi:membrane protein required for colicin V production